MPDNLFDNLDTIFINDSGEPITNSPITEPVNTTEPIKEKESVVTTQKVEDNTIDLDDLIKAEENTDVTNTDTTELTDEQIQLNISEGIKSTAKFLLDSEVLNEVPEDFDGSMESFKQLFIKEDELRRQEIRDEYTKEFPPILKELAERWEEGVPLDKLIDIKSNQIRYSNISEDKLEESESLQENLLKDYYKKTTRYSEDKINREIKRLKDLDELKDEAKTALPELKQFEEDNEKQVIELTRRQQIEIEERNKETIKKYEQCVNSLKEVLPGYKITDKEKKDLFKSITTPVAIDGNNRPLSEMAVERSKDPINFDIKLNHFLKLTNYLTDFSKIMKIAETNAATKIEKSLESVGKKPEIKTGTAPDGMNSMFEALAKMNKSRVNK